jgi:hypothetical protein
MSEIVRGEPGGCAQERIVNRAKARLLTIWNSRDVVHLRNELVALGKNFLYIAAFYPVGKLLILILRFFGGPAADTERGIMVTAVTLLLISVVFECLYYIMMIFLA